MFDKIKQFLKSKLSIENEKMKNIYIILVVVFIVAVIGILLVIQYNSHIYTAYDVVSSVETETSDDAISVRLKSAILTYSKDGAHCTDFRGNVKWNKTYEIQDIMVATCDNIVAIAGYDGQEIYVIDSSGKLVTVITEIPIKDIKVSSIGYVTATLVDRESNTTWVNTYNSDGVMKYKSSATMANSGYPAAVALSPDANMLSVAYMYVTSGMIKTNMKFYNFGEIGDTKNDHMVAGYTYTDIVVPEIYFLNNETIAAVSDTRLMIYKGKQIPVLKAEFMFNNREVQSIFSNSGYIGVVFYSQDIEHKYQLDVYNTSAKKVGTYYFDIDYADIVFEKNDFVVYNETECVVMTYKGVEKFNGIFSSEVDLVIPTGKSYRYIILNKETISTIQLK